MTDPDQTSPSPATAERPVGFEPHNPPLSAHSHPYPVYVVEGYEPLFDELIMALNQSQNGKGSVRHANARPFDKQPTLEIARMVGPGGPAQQVMKKTREAVGMARRGEYKAACAELQGAIVYAAATAILIREMEIEQSDQLGA